jgi:hypothetical protein
MHQSQVTDVEFHQSTTDGELDQSQMTDRETHQVYVTDVELKQSQAKEEALIFQMLHAIFYILSINVLPV